jgi:uncharacterized membrane protein
MPTKNKKATESEKVVKNDVQDDKALAILCYLGILILIPLILKPKSEFIKFHSKQGIVLLIGWLIGVVLYPFLGLGFLVHVAMVIFSILGIMNVLEGKKKDLPFVGDFAKKFKF